MRAVARCFGWLIIALPAAAGANETPHFMHWDAEKHQLALPGLDSAITFGALIHVDSRMYVNDKNDQENDVLFRRFRTGAKLDMPDGWSARAVLEWAENTDPFFTDATLDKKFDGDLAVKLGKFKAPLNFERLLSGTDMYFMERGYPDNFVASRDIGIQVGDRFWDRHVEWQLAIMQGAPDGSSTEQDDDAHKELMGRLYSMPWREQKDSLLHGLGFGIAAAFGERDGDDGESLLTEGYRTPSQLTFFEYNGDARADGSFVRIFPQLTYRYKNYATINEWTLSHQSVNVLGQQAKLLHHAWQSTHSYVLTGEHAGYRGGVVPASVVSEGGIGAWELAARIGGMVMDHDSFPIYANPDSAAESVIGTGLGVNWYPETNIRMMLNYEYADFEGGAPGGHDLPDEHAVFARVQFEY